MLIIFFIAFIFLIALFIILFFYINYKIENWFNDKIFTKETVKENKVWLVLWAWTPNWNISWIYEDRLKMAFDLYKSWKIKKILVSWDNWSIYYDELTPAKKYLKENWVKDEDVFLDYAWFDTYQSIYRAKEIFLNNTLTIITQEFQLKRALYICNWLGIDCVWVSSDLNKYMYSWYYSKREKLARFKAFFNITFKPKPKYLWEKIIIK